MAGIGRKSSQQSEGKRQWKSKQPDGQGDAELPRKQFMAEAMMWGRCLRKHVHVFLYKCVCVFEKTETDAGYRA